MLGESFEHPQPEQTMPGVGKTPRLLIENLRGNARIVGADADTVKASGRMSVRSFKQSDAEKVCKDCKLEIVRQGDLIVVRTNQDRAPSSTKVTADLEITVPRGATVEARGLYGDFELVDIAGQSTINGSYRGEMTFRNLAKPVRVEDQRDELRCERIPGTVSMSRGEFSGNDVVGPIIIRGQSKDVELSNFTESLEVSVDRGDIDIRPGRTPMGKMDVKTRGGNVTLALPAAAKFAIEATTDRGEIDNSYGEPLRQDHSGKGAKLEGSVGAGPVLRIHTDRGTVHVNKGEMVPPVPPTPPAPPAAPKVERL